MLVRSKSPCTEIGMQTPYSRGQTCGRSIWVETLRVIDEGKHGREQRARDRPRSVIGRERAFETECVSSKTVESREPERGSDQPSGHHNISNLERNQRLRIPGRLHFRQRKTRSVRKILEECLIPPARPGTLSRNHGLGQRARRDT